MFNIVLLFVYYPRKRRKGARAETQHWALDQLIVTLPTSNLSPR
ncbi:hypothetical protein IMCC3088_2806 [Aequoribacter fuscus]|uniref:Uncharacterized protein n=1 Tax=Aequoribacter fuscus TaxID=2518989 RepID=F3L527_9GAMM|nr:hypothetical protein IMCC3088_2806 [Aequoribacter fuscus]